MILESGRSLEEELATHSNILARKIPRTEEPGSYSPWGRKELDMTERLGMSKSLKISKPQFPYLCGLENNTFALSLI